MTPIEHMARRLDEAGAPRLTARQVKRLRDLAEGAFRAMGPEAKEMTDKCAQASLSSIQAILRTVVEVSELRIKEKKKTANA